MDILSMNISFILKSMVKIEIPIIVEFILKDQFLRNLNLIIMGS